MKLWRVLTRRWTVVLFNVPFGLKDLVVKLMGLHEILVTEYRRYYSESHLRSNSRCITPHAWVGGFNFFFQPYLGRISNLTNNFLMGWNHQPGMFWKTHLRPLLVSSFTLVYSPPTEADTVGIFSEVQEHVRSKADVVIFDGSPRRPFCG